MRLGKHLLAVKKFVFWETIIIIASSHNLLSTIEIDILDSFPSFSDHKTNDPSSEQLINLSSSKTCIPITFLPYCEQSNVSVLLFCVISHSFIVPYCEPLKNCLSLNLTKQ
ncbi:hypothetical protein BpHYR1_009654 [Brachionus plicatilis]|uniref:Uncharacterized protein n=1 Tax=Brachionus plicatilis TaxID=10195 RepID=A0A3M7PQP7_BRAPC|nr:hypothetical protein BpHYR1_009654 [Brachionus plicatilis]